MSLRRPARGVPAWSMTRSERRFVEFFVIFNRKFDVIFVRYGLSPWTRAYAWRSAGQPLSAAGRARHVAIA